MFLAVLASLDLPHQVLEDAFKAIKVQFGGEGYVFMNQCGEIMNGSIRVEELIADMLGARN